MVSPGAAQPDGGADLILRGGTIYSGAAAPFRGDVAIRGDRITYVGPKAPGTAARTIDATGLIVAPGFIDPHTHVRSEEHTSELQSLMRISYAVFCLKKKKNKYEIPHQQVPINTTEN